MQHTELVDEHEGDHGRKGEPEGGDAHAHDGSGAAAEAAEGAEEGELFDKEVNERFDRRDRLPEDGRNGGACRAAFKHPYEHIVEHDVGAEAREHGDKGERRPAVVADGGHEPRREDLKDGAQNDDVEILLPVGVDVALRAEEAKDGSVQKEEGGHEGARKEQHPQGRAEIAVGGIIALAAAQRPQHRAAHADARAERLDERDDGEGDVDGGKALIPDALPDEEAVDDGIHARKREGEHGGHHIFEKGAQDGSVFGGAGKFHRSPQRKYRSIMLAFGEEVKRFCRPLISGTNRGDKQ